MLEGLQPAPNRAYYCKVQLLKKELQESDFAILEAALADTKTWSAKGLQMALRQRNVILADTVITRHRNKACWCYKTIG